MQCYRRAKRAASGSTGPRTRSTLTKTSSTRSGAGSGRDIPDGRTPPSKLTRVNARKVILMPPTAETIELIRLRHPEWREHQLRWRWLLDSLEGGERYRQAIYGHDLRGLPIRNLIRHKREYPDPRESRGGTFSDPFLFGPDRVEPGRTTRPSRPPTTTTSCGGPGRPVPTFVAEAIDTHLSRIYAREVKRVGDERLMAWWADVDGCGTSIDQWMAETVAPLL